jgi:hypothetical protein
MNIVVDTLKKYDLYEKADREFKKVTKGDSGSIDFSTKYNIYETFIDDKMKEKKTELFEQKRFKKCDYFPTCEFSISYDNTNCQKCDFFNNTLKKIEEEIEELNNASMEANNYSKKYFKDNL